MIADVREEDLPAGVAELSGCSRAERKYILKSVEKALDNALKLSISGRSAFTEQQLRDIANDIGLWFAGEVIAGRAERYKVVVQ